jgi:DNA-directed RNA polymerase subunit beta
MEFEVKFVELKDKLVEKLFLIVNGKTSGVMNDLGESFTKGKKYTQKNALCC